MTTGPDAPTFATTGSGPRAFVGSLVGLLREHYVDPKVADQASALLSSRSAEGAYDDLGLDALASRVTEDLQRTNGDLHLRLVFHPEPLADTPDEAREIAEMTAWAASTAFGVAGSRRLAGEVAVLELGPLLFPPSIAAEAVGAAFSEAHDAAALVLDLRECRGGDPEMVAFACTYLFGADAVHLNDIVEGGGRGTRQFWTLPYVPGKRFGPDKPVVVATSGRTFSGGEEMAYDLQQLGRAVIVGESTRGGANPRRGFRLGPHLEADIPVARAVNPRNGSNWEGTGVRPDVEVPADDAVDTAVRLAASRIAQRPPLTGRP